MCNHLLHWVEEDHRTLNRVLQKRVLGAFDSYTLKQTDGNSDSMHRMCCLGGQPGSNCHNCSTPSYPEVTPVIVTFMLFWLKYQREQLVGEFILARGFRGICQSWQRRHSGAEPWLRGDTGDSGTSRQHLLTGVQVRDREADTTEGVLSEPVVGKLEEIDCEQRVSEV